MSEKDLYKKCDYCFDWQGKEISTHFFCLPKNITFMNKRFFSLCMKHYIHLNERAKISKLLIYKTNYKNYILNKKCEIL